MVMRFINTQEHGTSIPKSYHMHDHWEICVHRLEKNSRHRFYRSIPTGNIGFSLHSDCSYLIILLSSQVYRNREEWDLGLCSNGSIAKVDLLSLIHRARQCKLNCLLIQACGSIA